MEEIILHHFDASPFAEKIRLVFGVKGISWKSVQIPMVMPKPDLTTLTGGYRKTPVMQIGADIYCDTQCIALELERRFPNPTLFPKGSYGLCSALSTWSDLGFFRPGAALSMGTNQSLPDELVTDRQELFTFLNFESLQENLPHYFSQFSAHLDIVESIISHGRPFVFGDDCSWADICAYFPIWMAIGNIKGADDLLAGKNTIPRWIKKMDAIGYGHRQDLDAQSAISVAYKGVSEVSPLVAPARFPSFDIGDWVSVTPDDYGSVPVSGKLERLTTRDIAIRRSNDRVGEVVVHFPRIGYIVEILK